jgi:hypothetical protein
MKSRLQKSATKLPRRRRNRLVPFATHDQLVAAEPPRRGDVTITRVTAGHRVRIAIGADSLHLQVDDLALSWSPEAGLRVEAERLKLVGTKHISLETAGDLELRAGGQVTVTGSDQVIAATVGNVDIRANDDVVVHGERILLNS